MKMVRNIKILKASNFKDLEALYDLIEDSAMYKLQVPKNFIFSGAFGIEGAALQLYATLLRKSSSLVIHTPANEKNKEKVFEDMCNHLFGLCTLRLSNKILTNNKTEVELKTALRSAFPIFSCLREENYASSFKGPYVAFPSIKSVSAKGGRSREFDIPLYNDNNIVNAKKFLDITKRAICAIHPSATRSSWIDGPEIENLSEIIRELFTNTHKHARLDGEGNLYEKNIRAVTFRLDSISKVHMEKLSKSGGINLATFFSDWSPEGSGLFKAIDITVMDSGPGYARRWSGVDSKDLSFTEEVESIVNCFRKHSSSDFADASGSGLSNVLKDLKELNGWMRLRTGHALVEKSFFNKSGKASIAPKDIKKRAGFAEGVVFNVVIPVESLGRMK